MSSPWRASWFCSRPYRPARRIGGKNGRIALYIDRGQGSQIYTIRANGGDLTRITDVDGSAQDPDWSPDGSKIVFDIKPVDDPGKCGIWMMNADRTGLIDLTGPRFTRHDSCQYGPTFTPDGKRIVYAAQRCGRCTLWLWSMNLQGRHRRRIFAPRGYFALDPSVSPDGRTIAFGVEHNAFINGKKLNLKVGFTVRLNGTHLRQIVPFTVDPGGVGEWSPSGDRIDDSSQVDRLLDQASNLFTMRPDGNGVRYLTHYRSRSPDMVVGAGTYSPDGRWIVFKHQINGRYVLLKIRSNGTHLTRLRTFKANFFDRDWRPQAS